MKLKGATKRLAKDLDPDQGERTLETVKDIKSRTALHISARSGKCDVCKFLIEKLKFDVNVVNETGNTPLHEAISGSEPSSHQTTRYLLQNGADVTKRDNKNYSPLHYAAQRGSRELMQLLLENGADADINLLGQCGAPLHCASAQGRKEVVELLLQNGADTGANPNVGVRDRTPLSIAARMEKKEVIKILLKFGADPNIRDGIGHTALEHAALARDFDAVRLLLHVTSPISSLRDWSIIELLHHVDSAAAKLEREMMKPELFLSAITKGGHAFTEKDYNDAVYWYTEAIDVRPDPALFYLRSKCWYNLGEGDQVLSDAIACLKVRPRWSLAHYMAGLALKLLEEYPSAAQAFMTAFIYDPDDDEIKKALLDIVRDCCSSKVIIVRGGSEIDTGGVYEETIGALSRCLYEM